MRRLLVACGEPLRADDAVAFAVVDLLGGRLPEDVVLRRTRAPSPEDFLELDAGDVCVVADAIRGVPTGAVVVLPLAEVADDAEGGAVSTHALPLRDSLRIARSVLGFTPRGSLVGIGAEEFGLGADMSDEVAANLESFAMAIEMELRSPSAERL